nr:hypothetical protein Q903MT_gene1086 [Picea sitchensis]
MPMDSKRRIPSRKIHRRTQRSCQAQGSNLHAEDPVRSNTENQIMWNRGPVDKKLSGGTQSKD